MKISVIQMNIREGDTEYNFSHAEALLDEAAENSPDVIILPETWNTGFFPKRTLHSLSDKNALRTKELLSRKSKEYNVNIIGGSTVCERDGRIYNTCYVYDRSGNNIAEYSKIHLFSPMEEDRYFEHGDTVCLFSLDGVKCAVCICYDIRFPELVRRLALEGADILFVPMQWPEKRIAQMEILMRARAVENQMFTLACNSVGICEGTVFAGNSLVCSPAGNILCKAADGEEIITVNTDLSEISALRALMDVFSDRREDVY